MAYEHKPGRGGIFPNDRKDNPKAPDWKGDLMLPDGTLMALAGWRMNTGTGISLKLSERMAAQVQTHNGTGTSGRPASPPATQAQNVSPKGKFDDMEDDIPF